MPKLRRSGIILLLVTAIGLLTVGVILVYFDFAPQITIQRNEDAVRVHGRFDTVGDAIKAADIELREEDYVWPSLEEPLPPSNSVSIQTASPVELRVDGQARTAWTHQNNLASFFAEQGISLRQSSIVRVNGLEVPLALLDETAVDSPLSVTSFVDATIVESAGSISVHTQDASVGQTLSAEGIDVFAADSVEPALNSRIQPGQMITIERSAQVEVIRGNQEIVARTSRQDVATVLAELGIGLIGRQQTVPGIDQPLSGNETITIEEHTTEYEVIESSIPYSSQLLPLDTLEIDQRTLVSTGTPGVKSQLARIDTIGSNVISDTLPAEWISQPSVNEVVGYGTNIVVRTLETPDGPISYWRVVRMRVTAYTAASAGKSPDHPSYGITASGRPAGYGVVAIDPNVVPFRSQVYVPGYGVAYAGDTGGGVKGRFIDLGYDVGEIERWSGYVDVYYLTPVPDSGQINYLIP